MTVISSAYFAWFGSADNKSRIGFLTHLHDAQPSYVMNDAALAHMRKQGLKQEIVELLQASPMDGGNWSAYLDRLDINGARHRRIATEAMLLGGLVAKGIHPRLGIVSDGAGQFDILEHGLCWVHTERLVHKLIPSNDLQRQEQQRLRGEIWTYYAKLKDYRAAPLSQKIAALQADFDALFGQRVAWATLDRLFRRIRQHKDDLLRVLTRPDLPLHTNASETDIRDYVKVRKISGGTRSDLGRQCRDTFASLKKTCRKLGVSFWAYLTDRLTDEAPLRCAIRQQRKVTLSYRDLKDEASERTVWPFALGYFEQVRVLVAWCQLRQGFRHFRVDRITWMKQEESRYPKNRESLLKAWRATQQIPQPKFIADRN